MLAKGKIMTQGTHHYLLIVECPHCNEKTQFVESRDFEVNQMQSVELHADYCPHCGLHLWTEGLEWDVHEDAEIERVIPSTERGQ